MVAFSDVCGGRKHAVAGGPESVVLLALLVKMGGNKLQLLLLKNFPKAPLWLSNISVFAYEYATALLIRMMMLSIPSQSTAISTSRYSMQPRS